MTQDTQDSEEDFDIRPRVKPLPCWCCGEIENLHVTCEPTKPSEPTSQYSVVACRNPGCGNYGPPSHYYKDSGLDGLSETELAITWWNTDSRRKQKETA